MEWPSRIDKKILFEILSLQKLIEKKLFSQIKETVNTYNSLTIFFRPDIISFNRLYEDVRRLAEAEQRDDLFKIQVWEIPVCYDSYFGIDLESISKSKKLTTEEVIKLHSETMYTVYFTGFLPGFLYLGGLSEKLFTSRKETPRPKILSGAVAIGGSQTGIYPQESPGGWNIIGNSPIPLFDVTKTPPCKINAGDQLKFIPISRNEYDVLLDKILSGSFDLKPTVK